MLKRVLAIPTAILGVLLSHELTYTLLTSSASKKHALEEATGHGWRESYPQILTFLILALFVSTYVGMGNKHKKLSLPNIFLMQEFAFLTIEFTERMSGHHQVMPSLSIILLGTILQIPATFVIKLLLKIVVEPILRKILQSKYLIIKRVRTEKTLDNYSNPIFEKIYSFAQLPRSPTTNI